MKTPVEIWNSARQIHLDGDFVRAGEMYGELVLMSDCPTKIKAHSLNNLGIICQGFGHLDKGFKCFQLALAMNPRSAEIRNNAANFFWFAGDYEKAKSEFMRAIVDDPKSVEAKQNLGVILLTLGDFRRGWICYENRWKCPTFPTKAFQTKKPRWKGQSLKGKVIMLTHEQGFGDTIMFIRYAKLVKDLGALRVRFLGPEPLKRVLERVQGVDEYLIASQDEDFDFHCPLLSLPKIFKTGFWNFPNSIPYLRTDVAFPRLSDRFRVGIAWAGRPEHGKDKWRSITAKHFEPLMGIPGIDWISLQVGPQAKQIADLEWVTPFTKEAVPDFVDTLIAVSNLDLVISVDTALVHLAGAAGKRVWMLTPYNPDWRWMLDRTDSPWYPTLRLCRQPKLDDWDSVFSNVKRDLINAVSLHEWQTQHTEI